MQKIDVSPQPSTQGASGASSSAAPAAAGQVRRVRNTWALQAKEKIGAYIGNRRLRKLASAVQIPDQDVASLSGRRREETISALSRILVNAENSSAQIPEDQIDHLFRSMLRENIRRLVMVQKSVAATGRL